MREAEINKLISEILVLSRLISQNTRFQAFVTYSGHVNKFEFRLLEVDEVVLRDEFQLDMDPSSGDIVYFLDEARSKISNVLATGELNPSDYNKGIYGFKEYNFLTKYYYSIHN